MLPNKNFDVPNPTLHHTSPRIHTGQFVILYLYDWFMSSEAIVYIQPHFGCGPAPLWLSISGSSNVVKVTAIECRKHLQSEAHWRSSLSKASRTTFHASSKINADQQKWIKIPKEPKNRRSLAGPIELKRAAWHWIGVDGTKAHKNDGNIDTKATILLLSLLLLLLLLLRVMVREGTDDDAKITKISKCTAPKETKTQFCCEFITGWSPCIQQLGVDTEGSGKILRQGKTNFRASCKLEKHEKQSWSLDYVRLR